MSRKLLQEVIGVTLVILFLVGCGAPIATPVSEAPAATSTPESPAAIPTPVPPTPTPEPPSATPTPEPPTATSTPLVLPSGLEKVAIGTAFNNQEDCNITAPLSAPIKFPSNTTKFAFQVVTNPEAVDSITISLDGEGMKEGVEAVNCNKYTIVSGASAQYQWGAAVSGLNSNTLKSGTYTLTITVNGQTIEVPFEIGSASPSTPASISEATVQPPSLTERPTARPTETETPAPLVQTVKSFTAPGETVTGITWDGKSLWLSDISGAIFKMDVSGKLLDSFPVENEPVSLAWDGSNLWMFALRGGNVVYQFKIKDMKVTISNSFDLAEGDSGGGLIRNDLEWDGKNLWFSNISQNNVYRISPSGNTLSHVTFPKLVSGVAWDGSHLWLAYNNDYFSNSTISMVDIEGNILGSFPSPVFGIEGLAWGDGYLWAVGKEDFGSQTEIIYQLDVSLAKNSVSSP